MQALSAISLLLFLQCLPLAGHALESDRDQPIKIEADRATINKKTGSSTYQGNVIVRQGSLQIAADRLVLHTREGNLDRMQATGQPVTFNQANENPEKNITGRAGSLVFIGASEQVVLENKAVLTQGSNTFRSERIVYHVANGHVDAGKDSGGERVTITIQPNTTDQNQTPPPTR